MVSGFEVIVHRPDEISAREISLGRQRPQYHLAELPQINRSAIFNRADGQTSVASSRATGQARRTLRVNFFLLSVDPLKTSPDRKDGKQ